MATFRTTVTAADRRRFARARARGNAWLRSRRVVVAARYDEPRDAVELAFRGGRTVFIDREQIPELLGVDVTRVRQIEVSCAGDAVGWRSLDIDVAVDGLLARAGPRN